MAHYSASYGHQSGSTLHGPPISSSRTGYTLQGYHNDKRNENAYAYETVDSHHGNKKYYKITEWKLELLAWIIGAATISGTVYILIHFNNTPVAKWPVPIQISTVVAFLAQVATAALLFPTEACIGQLKWAWFKSSHRVIDLHKFDEASRGPLGSIKLLFSLSPVPRLVHLGALITIFMLVFSTFFQQAVQTRLEPLENIAQQATVRRLMRYVWPVSPEAYSVDYIYHNDITRTNPFVTNTIVSGMVGNSQNLSDVTAFCPVGECSWEPYTTLAICSSTEDVSSQLIEQAIASNDLGWKHITLPGITVQESNLFLTAWLTTVYGAGKDAIGYIGQPTNITILDLGNPDSNLNDLAHIYFVYQDPCLIKSQDDHSKEAWRAFKGTIRLCLQTLKTTHNTSTDTVALDSFTNLTWVGTDEPQKQGGPGYRGNGTWSTSFDNGSENFTIDYATTELIAGQLATSFNMSASFFPGGDNNLYGSMFASNFVSEVLGPEPLVCPNSTEYGIKGFDKRIVNVITRLNNALRTSNSSTLVYGKSFRNVLFIHVKYPFLAAPGALFVAITIFFMATVLCTVRVPVWKSSQLAMLYTLHEPQKLSTKSAMEKEAEKMDMKFSSIGNWQLEHE